MHMNQFTFVITIDMKSYDISKMTCRKVMILCSHFKTIKGYLPQKLYRYWELDPPIFLKKY